ncbi:hypothetical protein ABZM74_001777 [Weissella confusa]|uniref:hypothetical protein n=1 Tax=Weissella confusa TaxID=1583 RepID=UPI00358FCD78
MTLFSTITKGMADGAETLQANFAKLAKAITSIGDDGTMTVPNLNVTNLAVTGTPQFTTTTKTFNGLTFTFTRTANSVYVTTGTTTVTTATPIGWYDGIIPAGYRPVEGVELVYLQKPSASGYMSSSPSGRGYFNGPLSIGDKPRIVAYYPTIDAWPTN